MIKFYDACIKLFNIYNQFVLDNFENGKAIESYFNAIKDANKAFTFKMSYGIMFDYDLALVQNEREKDLNLDNRISEFRFAFITRHESDDDFYGRCHCIVELETGNIYHKNDWLASHVTNRFTLAKYFPRWGNVHNAKLPLARKDFFKNKANLFN